MAGANYSLEQAGVRFDSSKDFTVGIEEEFQILDPSSLALVNRYEELKEAGTRRLGNRIRGELIASEVEICTDKCVDLAEAEKDIRNMRDSLFRTAADLDVVLGATGTHPFADWKDQHIIATPHYQRVEEHLRYCAWRNMTFGMHVHIGIRGRERIIAVYNALRGYLPQFLALSANSPFAEGVYTYLHSTRSQLFTKFFPRCNIPGPIEGWAGYADFMETLFSTGTITEPTQVWWSIRPHPVFGTLEVRICDCQSNVADTLAVTALILAVTAKLATDYDENTEMSIPSTMQVEENFWNAIRYGLDGEMIDFTAREKIPTIDMIKRTIASTSELHEQLGLTSYINRCEELLESGNGAQRQIALYETTGNIFKVFSEATSWCQPGSLTDERLQNR
jgi:carboxylate-amine ligase